MNRSYYLDNLKFILIILVVLGHFAMRMNHVDPISYLIYFIYIFHMPCFVFVNGYLAKNMNAGGRLRVDKILTVFWLYLIFKLGNALLQYVLVKDISLSLFADRSAPWYLIALCIWYLFVPLLERIKANYLIIGSLLIGVLIGYIGSIGIVMSLSRVFVFFPFFIIGFCLPKESFEAFLENKKLKAPAGILLLVVLLGLQYAGFFIWLKGEPHYITALVLLGCVLLTFLLSNQWLKKLYDFVLMPKLIGKLLK